MTGPQRADAHSTTANSVLRGVSTSLGVPGLLVIVTALTGVVAFPWPGGAYDARFAAIALAGACWFATLASGRIRWSPDKGLLLATALCAGVVLASTLASAYPIDGLFAEVTNEAGALVWVLNLAVFGMAASLPFDRRVAAGLAATFAWVAPVAFWGFGESLYGAVHTVLANGDYFAATMVLYLPIAFGLSGIARSRKQAVAWLAVCAILAIGVGTAGTSSGLAGLVMVLVMLGAFAPRAFGLHHGLPGVRWVATALGAVLLAIQMPQVMRWLIAFPPTARVMASGGVTRLNFWEVAGAAFAERPLLGWGVDGFARAAQRFMPSRQFVLEYSMLPQYALPADAHSLIWTMLALFGVAGAIAFGWLAFAWVGRTGLPFGAEPHLADAPDAEAVDDESRVAADLAFLRRCVTIGVAGYAVTLLLVPLSILGGSTLSLFAGLAIARRPRQGVHAAGRPRWVAVAAGCLAVVLVAACTVRVYNSVSLNAVSDSQDAQVRAVALDRALMLEPYREEVRYLRLLNEFAIAYEDGDLSRFHRAVDSERPAVGEYAPYLSFLVMASLSEAGESGRTDLQWERENLSRAARLGPGLPMPKASALQLAILEHDKAAADAALEHLRRDKVPDQFWKWMLQPRIGPPAPSVP